MFLDMAHSPISATLNGASIYLLRLERQHHRVLIPERVFLPYGRGGKKWIALPWSIGGLQIAYRKSWFAEVGYSDGTFPQTWEEYREVGKKLKAKNRPVGQSLGHTFGDAPAFVYPYLWSWGGKEVEADGKTVVLNSKEAIESAKFVTAFWKEAHDDSLVDVSDLADEIGKAQGGFYETSKAVAYAPIAEEQQIP